MSAIKSILSTFASAPAGFFVSCAIGKAYPDAFSGANDRRLKAIRDARIRATSACFPQVEATRGRQLAPRIKYDGYRLQIHLDKGRVTIRTRTKARAGEVLVSSAVKDLMSQSGIRFKDRGVAPTQRSAEAVALVRGRTLRCPARVNGESAS